VLDVAWFVAGMSYLRDYTARYASGRDELVDGAQKSLESQGVRPCEDKDRRGRGDFLPTARGPEQWRDMDAPSICVAKARPLEEDGVTPSVEQPTEQRGALDTGKALDEDHGRTEGRGDEHRRRRITGARCDDHVRTFLQVDSKALNSVQKCVYWIAEYLSNFVTANAWERVQSAGGGNGQQVHVVPTDALRDRLERSPTPDGPWNGPWAGATGMLHPV